MFPGNIQIISAPSILGLKPTGVDKLPEKLISLGLPEKLHVTRPVISQEHFNDFYSIKRDDHTMVINGDLLRKFSVALSRSVQCKVNDHFLMVLGGDCSILIGIMAGLKNIGNTGLIFMDAHADFYQPAASASGEAADMDLAIVTGKGPDLLTNINNKKPYVEESNVIHIGQRDLEETIHYGSHQIQDSRIRRWDLDAFRNGNLKTIISDIVTHMNTLTVNRFWIHFDADVLDDLVMPAVDYRLPGGLSVAEVNALLHSLLDTGKIAGMSISIYNPQLDRDDECAKKLIACLVT